MGRDEIAGDAAVVSVSNVACNSPRPLQNKPAPPDTQRRALAATNFTPRQRRKTRPPEHGFGYDVESPAAAQCSPRRCPATRRATLRADF